MKIAYVCVAACALTACSSTPPPPDWQLNSRGALERSVGAYLTGNQRVEAAEFARARSEVSSTGRIDVIARTELTRCAARVASLVFEPCIGFENLAQDAAPAERAYAAYLAGKMAAGDAALLPEQHRGASAGEGALVAIKDPLAKLIAAGVLFQTGRASPAVVALAAETASSQGWRRPLLAWLGVQAKLAEQGGDAAQAEQIRRRIALVQEVPKAAGSQ
jgi:hypothetical protein